MAAPTSAKALVLAAPTGGVNFRDPLAAMDGRFTPWSVNVCHENQYSRVRYGLTQWASWTSNALHGAIGLATYGASKMFAPVFSSSAPGFYDFTNSGGSSLARANTFTTLLVNSTFFCKNLFLWVGEAIAAGQGARYDGSSWSDIGYTGTVPSLPMGGVPFKGRMYIWDRGSNIFYYTDLEAITGASLHAEDLSSIFTSGFQISYITTFFRQDGLRNEQYIAFINNEGEILVHSGSYPGGSDWSIVSTFKVGAPCGVPFEFQGDSLVITQCGLVSLRTLVSNGYDAAESQTLSAPIDDYWVRLFTQQIAAFPPTVAGDFSQLGWFGVFWPDKTKIVIGTNGYIDKSGTFTSGYPTFFVLNTITKSWSLYQSQNIVGGYIITGLKYFNRKVYFSLGSFTNSLGGYVFLFEDPSVFTDTTPNSTNRDYSFEIQGAWTSLGSQATGKRVVGMEPVIDTNFSASSATYGMTASADFGVETSAQCTVPTHTGITSDYYSVGAQGNFFQYRLSGTTPSSGGTKFNFYSCTAYYTQGGIR